MSSAAPSAAPAESSASIPAALRAAHELLADTSRETRRRILVWLNGLFTVMLFVHVTTQLATAGHMPDPARDAVLFPLLIAVLGGSATYNALVLAGRRTASKVLDQVTVWGTVLLLQAAALAAVHVNPNTGTSMLADNALSVVMVFITGLLLGRRAAVVWFVVFVGSVLLAVQNRGPDFQYFLMLPSEVKALEAQGQAAVAARVAAGGAEKLVPLPITLFAAVYFVFGAMALIATYVETGLIGRVLGAIPLALDRIKVATAQAHALEQSKTKLEAELDLAQRVQSAMVPKSTELPGFAVSSVYRPALDVGGDYFDVVRGRDASWILIGDVSGHGVSAGLIMMMAQTAVRTAIAAFEAAEKELTPKTLLTVVNTTLRENVERIGRGQYMTVTALKLGDDHLTYAGLHQDLLVFRAATGQVDRVETSGVWLGLMDEVAPFLDDASLALANGDVLLLHTDGITEAKRNGQMLGLDHVAERLRAEVSNGTAEAEVVSALAADAGPGELADDVTLVTVRRR